MTEAVTLLKEGKVVIFPTETVYGVGVASSRQSAVRQIYQLKGRDEKKPLLLDFYSDG